MDLRARLEDALQHEKGYFRAQLLREDLARLERLRQLAADARDVDAFRNQGFLIEWTPGNARSSELKATLDPLLEAFYAAVTAGASPDAEKTLLAAWHAFDAQRMERLVGCLSRVPRPRD